jgi:hypothetical protein
MKREIQARLKAILVHAQSKRATTQPLEWEPFEQGEMLKAVNVERGVLLKPPITIDQIGRADTRASGHFSYTDEFALNCTLLVTDEYDDYVRRNP